jgi:hypothetical protein
MTGSIGGWYDSWEFGGFARNGMADFAGDTGVRPEDGND